jgi:pSer/pThr/pTyr-binding forkhead associated (FHA) protein
VGRQRGCDLRIPSAEVSRRHCILHFTQGQLTVEDLNSANGTFLNNRRVTRQQLVRPGDQLQIGPLTFKVQYPAPVVPQEPEPLLELVEDQPKAEPLIPLAEDKPVPADAPIPLVDVEDSAEGLALEFDDADTMNLPEGEDFREFLRKMDQ